MAATVEGVFKILDRASGPIQRIEKAAITADKAVQKLGRDLDQLDRTVTSIKKVETSTKNLGNQTKRTAAETDASTKKMSRSFEAAAVKGTTALDKLIIKLKEVEAQRATAQVDVDIAMAEAKIRIIKEQIRSITTQRARAELADLASDMTDLGAATDAASASMGGGIGIMGKFAIAAAALAPVIVMLAGAVGGLVGSLVGAVGGAGVLGGGLLGAFAAGLGSIVLVAKPALKGLKDYNKAVQDLNKAQQENDPTKIQEAQKQLDALAKKYPGISQVSRGIQELSQRWRRLTAPGQRQFFGILSDGIDAINKKLPLFARETNKNVGAARRAIRTFFSTLNEGGALERFIQRVSRTFRQIAPAISRGLGRGLSGLFRLISYALPSVRRGAKSFEDVMDRFDKWTKSRNAQKFVGDMVDAFKSVGRFGGAVVRFLGALFVGGGKAGNSLFDSMTNAINRWSKVAASKEGRQWFESTARDTMKVVSALLDLAKAFVDIADSLRPLVTVLADLVKQANNIKPLGGSGPSLLDVGVVGGALYAGSRVLGRGPGGGGAGAGGGGGAGGMLRGAGGALRSVGRFGGLAAGGLAAFDIFKGVTGTLQNKANPTKNLNQWLGPYGSALMDKVGGGKMKDGIIYKTLFGDKDEKRVKKGVDDASDSARRLRGRLDALGKGANRTENSVSKSFSSMANTVRTGSRQVLDSTNALLKAFGASPVGTSVGSAASAVGGAAAKAAEGAKKNAYGGRLPGFAAGGRIPGTPKGDHIPLYGKGGMLGIADGGELVVNRHTERRVNGMLGAYGTSLGREVSGESRPHSRPLSVGTKNGGPYGGFARGGRLFTSGRASWFGGPNDGMNVGTAIGVPDTTPGIALYNQGTLRKYFDVESPQGRRARLQQIDFGPAPWTGKVLDITSAALSAFGFNEKNFPTGVGTWNVYGPYGKGGGARSGSADNRRVKRPTARGRGAMANVANAIFSKVTDAANRKLDKERPAPAAVTAGVGGGGGAIGNVTGLQPIVKAAIRWARANGWSGSVTSGFRTYAEQAALFASKGPGLAARPGSSNHERGLAIDITDSAGFARAMRTAPKNARLYSRMAHEPWHWSTTGYQKGGRLPAFAGWHRRGGSFTANGPTMFGAGESGSERVTITPKGRSRAGGSGSGVSVHISNIEWKGEGDVRKAIEKEFRNLRLDLASMGESGDGSTY